MMEKILLILLFLIEVIAFAWLIIEAKKSREQRAQILAVENQILQLEKTIISMEETIIKKVDKLSLLEKEKIKKYDKRQINTHTTSYE